MFIGTSVLCSEKMVAVDPGIEEIRIQAAIVKEALFDGRLGRNVGSGNVRNCPAEVILTKLF